MKKPVIGKAAEGSKFIKLLLHGESGSGKTRFAASADAPLIFDIEGGTMSIRKDFPDADVVESSQITPDSLTEYIQWVATKDADKYKTVVIDSLTDLQQKFLEITMPKVPNPLQAYGQWQNYLRTLVNTLYGLNKNTILIARTKSDTDLEGFTKLMPELSPAAWSVVPAKVDIALALGSKVEGVGSAAKAVSKVYTQHPKYWTKTRSLLPATIDPSFSALRAAIEAGG